MIATAQQLNPPQSASWLQVFWEAEKVGKGIVTDTIYIHHTALPSGLTAKQLSDLHHERLYVARYNSNDPDPMVKGQTPWSGHFRLVNGRIEQVFYGYHWIVRKDGTAERLLQDWEVGWHASNWNENMRSVAIVLDGDFRWEAPPEKMLKGAAQLIRKYVASQMIKRLRGHYDNNPGLRQTTECPGAWFDMRDRKGRTGRDRLMAMAKMRLARE